MAGTSLLALIDDIATLLDDVAVMSKVAAKKTAGVLGDDLALNAQQLTGMAAERELPVVWAVAKGSFKNKFILVPAALLISAFLPWAVTPLLMLGGAFLCFEGAEKLAHRFLHRPEEDAVDHHRHLVALSDRSIDMAQFERDKIKGAVRTDFILSAEIIVISLGTVAAQPLMKQVAVLSSVAVLMTVGVYGLVAAIVKLDDLGVLLHRSRARAMQALGAALLRAAPVLMKTLGVVGTAAMFLVGGGILLHGVPVAAHAVEHALAASPAWVAVVGSTLADGVFGVVTGAVLVALVWSVARLRRAG